MTGYDLPNAAKETGMTGYDLPNAAKETITLPHASVGLPLVEFMHLVFTRMPCESYRRQLRFCYCVCVTSFER